MEKVVVFCVAEKLPRFNLDPKDYIDTIILNRREGHLYEISHDEFSRICDIANPWDIFIPTSYHLHGEPSSEIYQLVHNEVIFDDDEENEYVYMEGAE